MSFLPSRLRRAPIVLSMSFLLVLSAGCSDSGDIVADGGQKKDKEAKPLQTTPTTEPLESAAGKPCVAASEIPEAEGKPEVKVPEGPPPTELVKEDLVPGEGAEAAEGKSLSIHYIGIICSSGQQLDSSWDRGEPFAATITNGAITTEQGGVIPGWDQGIPGMKAGGRRQLVIPPELAYGAAGSPPAVAPDETLIFVIDLIEVK